MSAEQRGRLRSGKRKVQEKPDGTKFVTIPKEIVDQEQIEKGDLLDFQFDGEWPIEVLPDAEEDDS